MSPGRRVHEPLDPLLAMSEKLGELTGQNQAFLAELNRMNGELTRLSTELDKKHAQNVDLLESHKADDNNNFSQVFKSIYMVRYSIGGAVLILTIIWGLIQWAFPIVWQQVKGPPIERKYYEPR